METYQVFLVPMGNTKITEEINLRKNVTQCWIPPRKSANRINVGNRDMSSNGSYPHFYSITLYEILHCGFTFSVTKFNATYSENLSLLFSSSEDVISSLK